MSGAGSKNDTELLVTSGLVVCSVHRLTSPRAEGGQPQRRKRKNPQIRTGFCLKRKEKKERREPPSGWNWAVTPTR